VYQRYGLVEACLTGAGVFFVVAAIAAAYYMGRKKQVEAEAAHAAETAKSAMQTALSDPMLVAAGLQGNPGHWRQEADTDSGGGWIGLGFLASRNSSGDSDDETPEA
jgi:hypothetical protein